MAKSATARRLHLEYKLRPRGYFKNAILWADALRAAGADVVLTERVGSHGAAFCARNSR